MMIQTGRRNIYIYIPLYQFQLLDAKNTNDEYNKSSADNTEQW